MPTLVVCLNYLKYDITKKLYHQNPNCTLTLRTVYEGIFQYKNIKASDTIASLAS